MLLPHDDFLYSNEENHWYDEAFESEGKLFHTKLKNHEGQVRHLILKVRSIPDKENYFVLTFDDITELNLMKLFDKNAAQNDDMVENTQSVIKMMKVVKDNSSEIKMHNFYKGLTITNPAVLVSISDDETVVKTSYSQLKIVQLVKNTVISSEMFPRPVLIKSIKNIDFDKQTIKFSQMRFLSTSATNRKKIRLEPEEKSTISIFYQDRKFMSDTKIMDISIVSLKVQVSALPPGIEVGLDLTISIVLPTDSQPLVINTNTTVYRIDEGPKSYDLVLNYELGKSHLELLKTYMVKRQMALIREFKALGA